eukprot:jgi/Chlat1/7809/Chrsp66S07261
MGKPVGFALRKVVAPMVGQSDLAFRLLCRRHGADLAYTEMFHSSSFATDADYRAACLQSCPEDRPLVVQFCGNDPATMLAAAKHVEDVCDAVDVNLGCPQRCAEEGGFGAFLLDWDHVCDIVRTLDQGLKIPVFCKIRLTSPPHLTVELAQRLEAAGCSLLTVHGRERGSQRCRRRGAADLDLIRSVKSALAIPVLTNGNVSCPDDVSRSLALTGADGVMSAEGVLKNPAMFKGAPRTRENVHRLAKEYLMLCGIHVPPDGEETIRGHFRWFLGKQGRGTSIQYEFRGGFSSPHDLTQDLLAAESIDDFAALAEKALGQPDCPLANSEGASIGEPQRCRDEAQFVEVADLFAQC